MGLILLAAGVLLTQPVMAAGPAPIDLKSCAHFTILAGSTITAGPGLIHGDIGLDPGSEQGIPPAQVVGNIYVDDSISSQAKLDLTDAFNHASPALLPGGINVGNGELGGRTLEPGVYQSAPGSYGITSEDLTLHGGQNDVWVFQMASTLTVEVGRQVILTGGAQPRNIFWQVGSAATLKTSSVFKGTIMASASITMEPSSTIDGRALAQTGAVTFGGAGGSLPIPDAPLFTDISRTATNTAIVVLNTTPYFRLTLETNPGLSPTNWTAIATNTPITNSWTFIDETAMATETQRFYRAHTTTY